MVRRLRRKGLVRPASEPRLLLRSNQEWEAAFACDALATACGICILAIVDALTCECLTLEVDTSLSSQRVTRALEQAIEQRGNARIDSLRRWAGTDLAAFSGLVRGAEDQLVHIQPGPIQSLRGDSHLPDQLHHRHS